MPAKDKGYVPPLAQFPEITRWEPRCRICQLVRDEPGIARIIHDEWRARMAEDGVASAHAVVDAVAEMLDRQGITKLIPKNVVSHFSVHVDCAKFVKKPKSEGVGATEAKGEGWAAKEAVEARLARDAEELRAGEPRVGALGEGDNDYFKMWELFSRMMRRIVALDTDPTAFFTVDGKHDMHKLQVWTGMVTSAKSILEGLNKMRSSDKMTASVLDQHAAQLMRVLMTSLGSELRQVLVVLQKGDAARGAKEIEALMKDRVPKLFLGAVNDSLAEVKDKYGLVN